MGLVSAQSNRADLGHPRAINNVEANRDVGKVGRDKAWLRCIINGEGFEFIVRPGCLQVLTLPL